MAEMRFSVRANFEEVTRARQELDRLRGELKKVTKATDPIVVKDLTDKYAEQKQKVSELSSAMSRYATVMSSDYSKKLQALTREVYAFEMQADASKRKIAQISSEIGKLESKMRKGGLDTGTSAILSDNISTSYAQLKDEKTRLENLTGLGKQARLELKNMQAEYVKYSGSATPAKDITNQMTAAFSNMIEEMRKAPTVGEGISSLFGRLNGDAKQLAMSLVGGLGFEQLAEHIFNVRSQFQQLEISFTTMLGSEQQAGALMDQLIQTAARTPFNMTSITEGAKQLLAYGIQANEVNDTLVHLGDIAAGLNVPLSQLVYLYGTTLSQGRMFTMDLRQFMGRGIPMAETLGEIMGKTVSQVQEAVTKGEVGADLVRQAVMKMSEEGGRFGGLMDKQAETLQGRWSNIEDTVDQAFNEMGKKTEGIFGTGLDLISSLIENWETLVKVIGAAVVAVGTYKAGLMAAASIQKVQNAMTMASITEELNEKLGQARDQENNFRTLNGKDTKQYRSNRFKSLGEAIADTTDAGNEDVEKNISKQIEMAKNEGLITEQMARQLELKREQLVAQQKLADQERMEFENAKRAKEQEEEKARAAKADAEEMARINKANSPMGKIDAKITNLEAQNEAAKNEKELAEEATKAAREKVAAIDAQIEKQKELIEVQKQNVVDVAMSKSVGGYDDAFSDDAAIERENELMGEQLKKLDDLKQSRRDAANELYSASVKEREATEAYKDVHEQLKDAYAEEDELRNQSASSMEAESVAQDVNSTSTQANTTSKEVNSAAEGMNAASKNANASATTGETVANGANTASETANTTATNINSTSENVNTTAKQRNSLVTSVLAVGNKGLAVAHNVLTWATNALTTSLKGLWAAMLANPLTTLITLVSTAISVFAMFGDSEEDLAEKTSKLGNKADEASSKVRALFAILESTKEPDKHKDTIDALKAAYEEYGVKLDETKMKSESLKDQAGELIKEKEKLIGVIEEQTIAMEHQNAVQQAYDEYNDLKNNAKNDFAKATDGILTASQAGLATTFVSDEDLKNLTELSEKISTIKTGTNEWYEADRKHADAITKIQEKIEVYYHNLGLNDEQIRKIKVSTSNYIETIEKAKISLDKKIDSEDETRKAAEKTRDSIKKLSDTTNQNAIRNQLAKKSFKELATEMDGIRKICENTYHMTIKVNYDDKALPSWIKGMSQKQLDKSLKSRIAWLQTHKAGDMTNFFGGVMKTYAQIAQEAQMMQFKGNKVESTPTETEAQRKKRLAEAEKKKRAAERAAAKAEREQTQKETMEGNRKKASEDYANTLSSYSEKAEEDSLNRRIKLIDDSYEKERKEIWANYDKEKKTIEDGIDKLVEAKKKEDQTVWVNSGKNRKANMWKAPKSDEEYRNEVLNETMKDSKGNVITDGKGNAKTIRQSVQERNDSIYEQEQNSLKELEVKRMQSMYDYLKAYGTIQEQRYAISKEYDEKIAKETDKWKKKQLESEKQSALSGMDAKAMAQDINWSASFKGVGNVLKDLARDTLTKVDKYMKSDDFKKLPASDKKAYQDLRQSLFQESDQASNPFKTSTWETIEKDVKAYQESVKKVQEASEKHSKAVEEMEKAEKDYGKSQTKENKARLDKAKQNVDTTGQSLNKAKEEKDQSESDLTDSTTKAANGLSNFQTVLGNITSGTLTGFASGIGKVITAIAGDGNKLGNALQGLGSKVGGLIGAILSIIDALGEDPSGFISQILDKVANVIEAVISQLPQIIYSAIKGVGNIVGSVLSGVGNMLTFGAFSSLSGSNAKEVQETIDRLTDRNEILTDAIDGLTEELSKTSGFKAIETAKKAEDLQTEKEKNLKEIMEAQMGYHGSHHSFNYYWGGFTQKQIAEVSKQMGRTWSGDLSDIQNANEAKIILESPDLVQAIKDTGKGGYGNSVYEKLKDYAAEAGELEKITDELKESLTQTSFDSMKSDFISNLMDMKKSAKEFSNDFTTMLTQSMLNFALSDLMEEKMKPLYEQWAQTMKEKGQLSTDDINKYKAQYDEITKEGMAIRDNIADITGYKQSYEQSASSGAFESMSQDTGDELNGRFTAVQIATEGTYQVVQSIDQKLSQMLGLESSGTDIVGATKEEPQPKKEETAKVDDTVTKTISDKLKGKFDDLINDSLIFEGSTLGMIDSINKHRLLSGKHSLEYESGMSTEDLASYINSKRTDKFNTELASYLQDTNQLVATETPNTRGDSLLTADISLISQNVGDIYVAVDEGRTILAQSLMCLQSIDERQESWHKPLMQLCSDVNRMKEKVDRL